MAAFALFSQAYIQWLNTFWLICVHILMVLIQSAGKIIIKQMILKDMMDIELILQHDIFI